MGVYKAMAAKQQAEEVDLKLPEGVGVSEEVQGILKEMLDSYQKELPALDEQQILEAQLYISRLPSMAASELNELKKLPFAKQLERFNAMPQVNAASATRNNILVASTMRYGRAYAKTAATWGLVLAVGALWAFQPKWAMRHVPFYAPKEES